MENILEKLFNSLRLKFLNELKSNEQKLDNNGKLDVFKTYLTISKSQRDFRNLIESSAINKDILELDFSRSILDEALEKRLIRKGSNVNDNKLFISSNGLFEYYRLNDLNLNEIFISFDDTKFTQDKLRLKIQEKLFCIFLILFNAHSEDTLFDTTKLSDKVLNNYFQFLKLIESELELNGLFLGKKVSWGSGKDINFRKFITNNVDLPNIGIYNDRPTSMYWLDCTMKKNVSFLLDLLLDSYEGEKRILANDLFFEVLRKLSNRMLTELGEIPRDLNKNLIEILNK
jgi:hypothetical protein